MYAAKDRATAPLVEALKKDLRTHREQLPNHPALQTIFFGGGTPSLLDATDIATIIQTAHDRFGLAKDAEITLEANPNDVLRADLSGLRAAGVNRISLGVQSLKDDALQFLGRDHDSSAAQKAIDLSLNSFPSVSIDLIYARPGQLLSDWEEELNGALAMGAHHLSLYELTIEQRTAFGKAAARGELIPMPDDAQADLYELTQMVTSHAGYPAYEVSNHAVSTAHQSLHNMIYWQSGDWIGIGPGAHGRLTIEGHRYATEAARKPAEYIEASKPAAEKLAQIDVQREVIVMGLRPVIGIEVNRLGATNETAMSDLRDSGLIEISNNRLHTTPVGRLLTDGIAAKLSP